MELPRERVSSTPSPRHVPRAVAGTGGYRYRSNVKFIEWWHRTKKTVRESVNPFQRYKLLKSVMGSGRVGLGRVGSGRAYWDFCLKPQKNSLRASRSARNELGRLTWVKFFVCFVQRIYPFLIFVLINSCKARCPLARSRMKTYQNVAELQQIVLERGQNESAVCTGRSRLRFVNVLRMFCETKRNVKGWAVFNVAAIFTVLCYYAWWFSLWLVDINSEWLPHQLYQTRSYRNPTLLPHETCLLPYAKFSCDSFWIRSDTFCYVFVCDFASWHRAKPVHAGDLSNISPPKWKNRSISFVHKYTSNIFKNAQIFRIQGPFLP